MDEINKQIEINELVRDLKYKSQHSRLSGLESRALRILEQELNKK